jgi:hypothetical protein
MGLREKLANVIAQGDQRPAKASSFFDAPASETKATKPAKGRKASAKGKEAKPVEHVEESPLQTSIARPVGSSDKTFFSPASDEQQKPEPKPSFLARVRSGRGVSSSMNALDLSTHRTFTPADPVYEAEQRAIATRKQADGMEWLAKILSWGGTRAND